MQEIGSLFGLLAFFLKPHLEISFCLIKGSLLRITLLDQLTQAGAMHVNVDQHLSACIDRIRRTQGSLSTANVNMRTLMRVQPINSLLCDGTFKYGIHNNGPKTVP